MRAASNELGDHFLSTDCADFYRFNPSVESVFICGRMFMF
jgi:hypothetical protein